MNISTVVCIHANMYNYHYYYQHTTPTTTTLLPQHYYYTTTPHLTALLCVAMLEHLVAHKGHHLCRGVHVEEPVTAQQQELVLLADGKHLVEVVIRG